MADLDWIWLDLVRAARLVNQSFSQPVSISSLQPASQPVSQPTNQLLSQPVIHLANESFNQPFKSLSHLSSQPIQLFIQPVSQLAMTHLTSKPVSHSSTQPVSRFLRHTGKQWDIQRYGDGVADITPSLGGGAVSLTSSDQWTSAHRLPIHHIYSDNLRQHWPFVLIHCIDSRTWRKRPTRKILSGDFAVNGWASHAPVLSPHPATGLLGLLGSRRHACLLIYLR